MIDVRCGDCLTVMAGLEASSIDSIVTDPPYHLTTGKKGGTGAASVDLESPYGRSRITTGFMGKVWDGGDVAFRKETWEAALRVAKPGAYLLAFGGTRTFHRLAVAIEDAGWELRDTLMWVYGSGFPKSHNLGDGRGTALKPAWEPIIMARKPLVGTVAANAATHGTGALNIDACRIGWPGGIAPEIGTPAWGGPAKKLTAVPGQEGETVERTAPNDLGRWPANLIHDGSDEVIEAFPQAAGQLADASTNNALLKTQSVYGAMKRGRTDESSADSDNDGAVGFKMKPGARRGDSGSAARFFYAAKASKADREAGLESLTKSLGGQVSNTSGQHITRRDPEYKQPMRANTHPTVKPTVGCVTLCG